MTFYLGLSGGLELRAREALKGSMMPFWGLVKALDQDTYGSMGLIRVYKVVSWCEGA